MIIFIKAHFSRQSFLTENVSQVQGATRSFGSLGEVQRAAPSPPRMPAGRGIGRFRTAVERRVAARSLSDLSHFLEGSPDTMWLAQGALSRVGKTQTPQSSTGRDPPGAGQNKGLAHKLPGNNGRLQCNPPGNRAPTLFSSAHLTEGLSQPTDCGANGRAHKDPPRPEKASFQMTRERTFPGVQSVNKREVGDPVAKREGAGCLGFVGAGAPPNSGGTAADLRGLRKPVRGKAAWICCFYVADGDSDSECEVRDPSQ